MKTSFSHQLAEARTSNDLASVMDNRIKSYGFAGYVYWTHLRLPVEQLSNQNCFMLSRGPAHLKAFEVMYFNKQRYLEDPIVKAACDRVEPFTTEDIRSKTKNQANRTQRWLYALEKKFGFKHDIYIPVHTPLRIQVFYAFFLGDDSGYALSIEQNLSQIRLDATQFCASMIDFVVMGADDHTADILFSKREQECLCWMAKGRSNAEIGAVLEISERTVKFHVKNIMLKLNASNRTESIAIAARSGWIIN